MQAMASTRIMEPLYQSTGQQMWIPYRPAGHGWCPRGHRSQVQSWLFM